VKTCNIFATIVLLFTSLFSSVHATPTDNVADNTSLYTNHEETIWLENEQLTANGIAALALIGTASKHGLNPDKYHLSELENSYQINDAKSALDYDRLFTQSLLTFITDLSIGQLDPHTVDPQWFLPNKQFNAIEFTRQALLSADFSQQLTSLVPESTDYKLLKKALVQYQLYLAQGGWETIPRMKTVRPGERHKHLDFIRNRLSFENPELVVADEDKLEVYDAFLEQAVRNFQQKYSLKVDGVIGPKTIREMNVSTYDRVQQIKVALERHRWMPNELAPRHLYINLANYTLKAIDDSKETFAMKVIVGSKKRQTPSFYADLTHVVFNPYWNVPSKLARKDLLPKQQDDLNYFYTRGIRVFSKESGKKVEIDPYLIDWQSLSEYNFPYIVRQDPGKHNALGTMKFMFQNKWGIYLHDTNHRSLFAKTSRSLSSGCIRLHDPLALANFTLNHLPEKKIVKTLKSKENKGLRLKQSLPIYAVYITVSVQDNEVRFSPDIYKRDKAIAKLL